MPRRTRKGRISAAKLRRIRLVILDVDGVLSDGRIIYDAKGTEYKVFHARDGYGIRMASLRGILFAIVSGRRSKVVPHRARELGIGAVYQGVPDKRKILTALLAKHRLTADQVCCIGDDEPDLGMLRAAGLSAAPADAAEGIRAVVDYVTSAPGGEGAVREVLDLILKQKRAAGGKA